MFIDNMHNENIYTKINFLNKDEKNNQNNIQESNNFAQFFQKALGEVNNIQNRAQKNIEKFELNPSSISLNDVMINLQKSSISIQLAIQIRNKFISAYKEIMNQQI
ncbi:flagellar hook-basal body protein FliE [Buchnera aphidicola (Aphis glycines)]|uniref:Flagellar hook-basal body complex protein FliE n=1 Tax=Buchnera aphidicola (Aphis glycines) TaxID=1265350 RepID=A0A0M4HAM8_9GAMM|nr:flagellar hook-basal body complex protein FliE [Buchnera aphidicola]ALD15037.1 flagellar hook-basal body protein FliE [Buchnera aphidicola (Aphis glycines)]